MKTAPSVVGPLSDGPVGKRCFNEKNRCTRVPAVNSYPYEKRNLIDHNSKSYPKVYFSEYFCTLFLQLNLDSKSQARR